jgi:hypothetical protein
MPAQPADRLSRVPASLRAHAFKPGQSGNPEGRRRTRSISTALRDWMERPLSRLHALTDDEIAAMPIAEASAVRAMLAALDRDNPHALRWMVEIIDRTDGKPRQPVDMTIEDKPPAEMTEAELLGALSEVREGPSDSE